MSGHEFTLAVRPRVPSKLERLGELASNLWYSWDRSTRALFVSLAPGLWNRVGHNPKLFLQRIDEHLLQRAAADPEFLSNFSRVLSAYDTYHGETGRLEGARALADDDLVAYFCAEYGLHESLPIYSGGLGILAGHHCKTASDLRLPFVAVGLLYRAGYFSQIIDGEGRQIAHYVESDFEQLPLAPVAASDGSPLEVGVEIPGRTVFARVWRVRAGHVSVYLLDTNVPANSPEDRAITYQLYGGDRETRIQQELVLGVGGVRALGKLGIQPTVWHVNEGHAAFLVLERARQLVSDGLDFAAAMEAVAAATVFTTHTPVPAGHDHFSEEQIRHYMEPFLHGLGIDLPRLMALGRLPDTGPDFNMTTLAITGSRRHNGVSRMHGEVSAKICQRSWPQVPAHENPMDHITNGVHVSTVLAEDWVDLFDSLYGANWRSHLSDYEYWRRVHEIPDHLFWSVNQSIKSRTLQALREALSAQHLRNEVSEPHLDRMLAHIDPRDPNVLTIGFARRFATYKRAALVFQDLEWLRELACEREQPVVFVFAGKAHPADLPGQELLRRVHEVCTRAELVGHVLLVEGYDLALARLLLAGVDVWLNTPIFPLEASGTSGMKAAMNGTLNLSVADGWWAEGFEGDNGWAIRPSPHADDGARRDAEDARTLYEILQDDVVPLYYARGKHGYSEGWVHACKRSMASILPRFNMHRVVNEYAARLYAPAATRGRMLAADGHAAATRLARWKERVRAAWPGVRLRRLDDAPGELTFGEVLTIEVAVHMDGLAPADLRVELLLDRRDDQQSGAASPSFTPPESPIGATRGNGFERHVRLAFEPAGAGPRPGEQRFRLRLDPEWCGLLSYRIRAYPWNDVQTHPFETGLMTWL